MSSDDADEPSQIYRPTKGRKSTEGISLRWKIVIGMGSITVVTAILIFIVVYYKAVGQQDDLINDKGITLVKTLSTVDPQYWMFAIYPGTPEREAKLNALLHRLFSPHWGDDLKSQIFRKSPEVRNLFKSVTQPVGPEKREMASSLLEKMRDGMLENLNPAEQQKARASYEAVRNDPKWQADFYKIADPFRGVAKPLQSKEIGKSYDIVNITVQDVTIDDNGPTVQADETEQGQKISFSPASRRIVSGATVIDGREVTTGTALRLFELRQETPGVGKLSYKVVMSLAHIDELHSSLRNAIFLPIFVSALLGVGIAIWLSTFITEPIKILMRDMEEVSGGNLDHETVPVSRDEVGMLATTFNKMTVALRAAHEQELEAKAMEHELSIASEIQSNLVPKKMLKIAGYDIGAYYRPSKEVGGDYYDFIAIDEDNDGIIVADVSGKGVPGSLVMSMARAFIRMEAERSRNMSPSDTLMRANRMLAQDIKKGMFVTALYCILNKKTNEMRVASAGHNPMVVWRAASNQIQLVNPSGIALGLDKGAVFEKTVREEKVLLERGDRVVMFTDGTVEMMDAANEEFGDDRFYKLIQQLGARDSNQMINLTMKALDEHKSGAPQHDDITIVTFRYL